MDNKTIGLRLSQLREKKGLTTTQLGKLVGISQAQISRLENGKQGFRSATLIRISKAVGVKPIYFFLEDAPDSAGKVKDEAAPYGIPPESKLAVALRDQPFRRVANRTAEIYLADPHAFTNFAKAFEALLDAVGHRR